MALLDLFMEQGAVPAGVKPKTIVEPGEKAGYYQTDRLSRLLRKLDTDIKEKQETQKKQMEDMAKQFDMYKTLRDSGYDAKSAFEAVRKMKLPEEPATGITKGEAEIKKLEAETAAIPAKNKPKLQAKILEKLANDEELSSGERKVYDETIKHKGSDLESVLTGTDKEKYVSTREKIMEKISNNETLTAGEQRIYDEVIKKGGGDIENIVDKSKELIDYVPMLNPSGKKVKVHKDDVAKALKKGYKKR